MKFLKPSLFAPQHHSDPSALPVLLPKILLLTMVVAVFLVYSNTLNAPFILDDLPGVKDNLHIRIKSLDPFNLAKAAFNGPYADRPVSNLTFALNYYLHGPAMLGYRLTNLLIHISCGLLLYFFIRIIMLYHLDPSQQTPSAAWTIKNPVIPAPTFWIPFFSATVWLVHPIQTQSVSYLIQRMNSLAAMFYLLTLLLYALGRIAQTQRMGRMPKTSLSILHPQLFFALSLFSGLLAFGAKQNTATLPLFIFLYEWIFLQRASFRWIKARFSIIFGITLILLILSWIYLGTNPFETILTKYELRNYSMAQRLFTEFRIVIFYMTLLLFPHPSRLNLEHDIAYSQSFYDPATTWISLLVILGINVWGLFNLKKYPLPAFGILWYFGNLVIESSIIGVELIFEHRLYLPSMIIMWVFVMGCCKITRTPWLNLTIILTLTVTLGVWTHQRNRIWSDSVTLWQDCVFKSPQKPRPHVNLGVALSQKGALDKARGHYLEALRLDPSLVDPHVNLGLDWAAQGDLDKAIRYYEMALKKNPSHAQANNHRGLAYLLTGNIDKAIVHFQAALTSRVDYTAARTNLKMATQFRQNITAGVADLIDVLDSDKRETANNKSVETPNYKKKALDKSINQLIRALRTQPGFEPDQFNVHNLPGVEDAFVRYENDVQHSYETP